MTDLLFSSFVLSLTLLIDATEVGHYHRYRQGDDQHAAERTDTANHLAGDRLRYHVAIPDHHRHSVHALKLEHTHDIALSTGPS